MSGTWRGKTYTCIDLRVLWLLSLGSLLYDGVSPRRRTTRVPPRSSSQKRPGYILSVIPLPFCLCNRIHYIKLTETVHASLVRIRTLLTSRRSRREPAWWSTKRHTRHASRRREWHTARRRASTTRRWKRERRHPCWRTSAHGRWWKWRHVGRHTTGGHVWRREGRHVWRHIGSGCVVVRLCI